MRKILSFCLLAMLAGCTPLRTAWQHSGHDDGVAGDGVVDEPLGARYSLGGTLWHMGHQAAAIGEFHDFARARGLTPQKLLPPTTLRPPATQHAVLVEPEYLDQSWLNKWQAGDGLVRSSNGDNGPTVSIPLRIVSDGLYRLWVGYMAWSNGYGVTSLTIYQAGAEHLGPYVQPDEFYDRPAATNGPAWHDLLVDFRAGEYVVRLGHVVRWWHGPGNYMARQVDCLFATERLWDAPPGAARRQAWREAAAADANGAQWSLLLPLAGDEVETWRWWQLRPLAWEERRQDPRLFALSRQFWRQRVARLAASDYDEASKPDYRNDRRQVIFNEEWNMVANPARIRRQIAELGGDVRDAPGERTIIWHDPSATLDGLLPDGSWAADGPATNRGPWKVIPGELQAGWWAARGSVTTRITVPRPGSYTLWVRSNGINLSYRADWRGSVSVDGKEIFTYLHEGKITNIWMRMGVVTLHNPGEVSVRFTLDGTGGGGAYTYRRIHTLLLCDDPDFVPQAAVRPPWTRAQYGERARAAGARPGDKLLAWVFADPYKMLSQEVWADAATGAESWPREPLPPEGPLLSLHMPGEAYAAAQIGLRNLTGTAVGLTVETAPLRGMAGAFADRVEWRVVAFVPNGVEKQKSTTRQNWSPFLLLRRPGITVPPLNVAGVWLTVSSRGLPAGDYEGSVTLRETEGPVHKIPIRVKVSPVAPGPRQPVLVDGYTPPHEGEAYLRDFVDHGMKIWPGLMSRAEMERYGIRMLHLRYGSVHGIPAWYEKIQTLGLKRGDYFVAILDEPGGKTAESLKPFIEIAEALHQQAPDALVSFNPSEAATVATFEILAPHCDFWIPYSLHIFSSYWGNPQKWPLFQQKLWMWYSTPCYHDKTARQPGIRAMPAQKGQCVGVAFFALNFPWRDEWDTGYEHIGDVSVMGALRSRHGPVPTIVWEHIRETIQEADLAMMVRERLGVKAFEEIEDAAMQRLVREGNTAELLSWLERD